MSLADGKMSHKNLYTTSDIALAAYLLMRGFELLGAVDTGQKRKEFGLTHTDPEVLTHMEITVKTYADEFENQYLPLPTDPTVRLNFKIYNKMIKELHHSLDEAIRRDHI